jgi:hypothetical protein
MGGEVGIAPSAQSALYRARKAMEDQTARQGLTY